MYWRILLFLCMLITTVSSEGIVRRTITKSLLRRAPLPPQRSVTPPRHLIKPVVVSPDITFIDNEKEPGGKNLIAFALLTRENEHGWSSNVKYAEYLTNMIRKLRLEFPVGNPTTDFLLFTLEATSQQTVKSIVDEHQIDCIVLNEQQRQFVHPTAYTGSSQYRDQWVKLWLWNMTNYDLVMYIDADHYVRKKMQPLFDICKGHVFSATIDSTGDSNHDRNLGISDLYFNAGLFVLKPSIYHFNRMIHRLGQSNVWHSWAAEQGFFNWYWGKSYNILDSKWNVMHAGIKSDEYLREASCIHTKIYDEFPSTHWLYKEYTNK
jgi:Glycosyl transferase family 8